MLIQSILPFPKSVILGVDNANTLGLNLMNSSGIYVLAFICRFEIRLRTVLTSHFCLGVLPQFFPLVFVLFTNFRCSD